MSMFNKRHYEAIATVMQNTCPGSDEACLDNEARYDMWNDTREALAQAFASDNAQFQYQRFIRACLPGANVRARKAA